MSVLVEAITLVVQKTVLDISYPGGADGFCQAALALNNPPRFVCNGDAHLVNLSFVGAEHLMPAIELLEQHGLVGVDDEKFQEFACVDQRFGPTMPCEWLEWKRHKDGFTYAWLAGTEPSDMAAPDGWTAQQSRDLVRADKRKEPGRMMRLSRDESGVEVWLDFQTGEQIAGLAQDEETEQESDCTGGGFRLLHGVTRPAEEPMSARKRPARRGKAKKETPKPLMRVVVDLLEEMEWSYICVNDQLIACPFVTDNAQYDLRFVVHDDRDVLVCLCSVPVRVPEAMRLQATDYINRANHGLRGGNFELDPDDGEVCFRAGIDVTGGELTTEMAKSVIATATMTCDEYFLGLMKVVFGRVAPAEAIREIECDGESDETSDA